VTRLPNAYVERIIGSIRRECLNHVIIFDERHLRSVLSLYFHYITRPERISRSTGLPGGAARTPTRGRPDHRIPRGRGLHHRYERRAA
jgi:putative transposase